MRVSLLPADRRLVRPWKNGGGTTTEIATFPRDAGLENFEWRISMASVAAAGPFSHFDGVDRILAVIEGRLALAPRDGAGAIELTPECPPHAFPGEISVFGTPLCGAVVDLNLMTRRHSWRGSMRRIEGLCSVTLTSALTILLFVDEGHFQAGPTAVTMRPLDAVRVDAGMGEIVDLKTDDGVFLITVSSRAEAARILR